MSEIKMGDKLYVIVRNDISPGRQIAQACHGMRQFYEEHPLIDKEWFVKSNYIVVLNAKDEMHLFETMEEAVKKNVSFSAFKEPDLNDEVTAIVLAPSAISAKMCRRLPLAFSAV